ncbi:MAG: zinc ABC transporter substrate-binding protein [Bacilli bacterium]|nr:zinc ABC transporter substrate-binding protein [Bacilli bacterium]
MKKKLLFPFFLALASLCSCGGNPASSNTIFVSFYPLEDFASKIAKGKFEIENITPVGMEPHDYEPSAKLIGRMSEGKGFLANGLEMEHYLSSLPSSLLDKTLVCSKGVTTIKNDNGIVDPHIWLDPSRAKIMADNIKDFLISIDRDGASFYQDNYADIASKFDTLDAEIKEAVKTFKRKTVVVSHAAFGYLCDAYGLTQKAIHGLEPSEEPTAATMAEIIDAVKKEGITTIFAEEMVSPEIANKIAQETGAKVEVLSPIEGLEEEDVGKEDYFSIMRDNLAKLKEACCD